MKKRLSTIIIMLAATFTLPAFAEGPADTAESPKKIQFDPDDVETVMPVTIIGPQAQLLFGMSDVETDQEPLGVEPPSAMGFAGSADIRDIAAYRLGADMTLAGIQNAKKPWPIFFRMAEEAGIDARVLHEFRRLSQRTDDEPFGPHVGRAMDVANELIQSTDERQYTYLFLGITSATLIAIGADGQRESALKLTRLMEPYIEDLERDARPGGADQRLAQGMRDMISELRSSSPDFDKMKRAQRRATKL